MNHKEIAEAIERATDQSRRDLLCRIAVSMASFIAELDENSADVARYIEQRLEPLLPLLGIDARVEHAMAVIANDARRLIGPCNPANAG